MRGTRSGAGFQYSQSKSTNALKLPVVSGNAVKDVILGKIKCRASSDRCPERQHVSMYDVHIYSSLVLFIEDVRGQYYSMLRKFMIKDSY
ncbi:hypothetical protein ACN42_g7585 [Penicillium freii]|uniref:Uncharacterized protein n=1 Tax=Penicillium freii TaxID=48697 RepID=A0A101MFC5_PENFR|nr:hypothetical protein ACN42_g7585 [Penicillium freii]